MISVIMPVRDEERLVGRAIRSVLDQTFRDLELIVVDNGSTDGTVDAIGRIAATDPRLRLVHESEPGTFAARNRGLAEARHRWVALQDADDVSHPQRLERTAAHVARRPRTVAVGSWAIVYSETGGLREPLYHATSDRAIRSQLRTGPCPFVNSSVLASRDACLRVGGYPAGYPSAEDYALWCMLQDEGDLANLPMHLTIYRHQDREPDSPFRTRERAVTEALKSRWLRPPTRLDRWRLRLTDRSRRAAAFARIEVDWPRERLAAFGLEALADRRPPAAGAS